MKHLIFMMGLTLSLYGGWAEKTLETLSVEEKVGQLFVVPACPKFETERLDALMESCHIGAVIIKQGHPKEQIPLLNRLQRRSKLPLLCTGDAEWGLGMRMEETLSFPKNGVLGKVEDLSLLRKVGKEIGVQCRMVGIHLNFAPVVDVNNNPENSIIGMRSFGEDPARVSVCAAQIVQGMKEGGVLSCLKHFPGHGDTSIDSHTGLPCIPHDRAHLENVEFVPFKRNLCADAVMTGHLLVPALDAEHPATLSRKIVTDLLKGEWGFKGLIVTDALNMKALSEHYAVEEIALKAFDAGHDLLLYGSHLYNDVEVLLQEVVPKAYQAILNEVKSGAIPLSDLDGRVLKTLQLKERLGLHKQREISFPEDLMEALHNPSAQKLISQLEP